MLVLGYSESELNSVYLVGFLSLLGRFWNFLRVSICKTLTCLNVIIVVFLKTKIGKDNLWKPERVV